MNKGKNNGVFVLVGIVLVLFLCLYLQSVLADTPIPPLKFESEIDSRRGPPSAKTVQAQAGNITELIRINDEMNTLANEVLMYMVWWHDTEYFVRSSWLQGWYHNANFGANDLWSTMYFEQP